MRSFGTGLIFVMLWCGAAHGIGVRTHSEMAERAMDDFLLKQPEVMLPGMRDFFSKDVNRRAIYSGNAFTDWGYGGINHQAGEDCHWFPFLNAYAAVLKERHPLPWTDEAEREIAFFLGMVCHSITDLPWHFGNAERPSFIEAATAGDGSGHIACDFGSDIFTHTSQTLYPTMGYEDFFFPIDTIHAAYERFGKAPARAQMQMGANRERAMWLTGEKKAAALLPRVRERSPWVGENLEGYFFGGTQNNSANVAHWFRHFYAFLKGGAVFQNSPEFANAAPGYVPYAGVQDVTLLERAPEHNAGGEPLLAMTGRGDGDARETRLRFDVSNVALASVSSATLWIWVRWVGDAPPAMGKELACYTLGAAWQEGEQFTDVVHGHEGRFALAGEVSWSTAAGAVDGLALAAVPEVEQSKAPVSIAPIAAEPSGGQWIAFDVSAAVRAWAAHPESNHGLALRETPASKSRPGLLEAFSSEAWKNQADGLGGGDRVNYRPMLVVLP